ncbi:hypothetical protein [Duganella vulcania]|uniref:Uncharacterized protein n=1 Tax=Duganella vulcania TaxID=2692166 RepID=A0A845GHA6_9BURK|nr:hypothetical protein [Duganella vulcania]MYM92676.1 hypothetical protein [Duganella vulcania]
MTTTTRAVGHATLTLKQLAPSVSAAFSPNLHSWMRAKAHFYKGGGVLQTVYRVKPDTKLAKEFGAGTLMIGFPEDPTEKGFVGVRLMSVLCQGTKAGDYYYLGMAPMLEEVEGFWDQYLKVGRCAIDPEHKEGFMADRYSMDGDVRTCRWCGAKHERVLTPRTVFDETWKSA